MSKKQTSILNIQRVIGIFLFSVVYLVASQETFAQNIEADLEAEFAMEDISQPSHQEVMPLQRTVAPAKDYGNMIVVEKIKDLTLPYKQRRNQWGVLFSINYEQFVPENYFSLILNKDYSAITGDKSIPLMGAEFGVKYNFSLGSISALVGYAQGQVENAARGLDNISMSIGKADLNIAFDNLFNEPYVVPFAQLGIHSIDWVEKASVGVIKNEESFKTDLNFHFKVGLSFQLNWIEKSIDPSSAEDSVRSGLENTYLDIFYTAYAKPAEVAEVDGATGEADLQSSQIGAGLKLEF